MITIITKNKVYKWNPRVLLKNLAITGAIILFIIAFLYASHMEYMDLIN